MKIIGAALFKKTDLKCGAHSRAVLNQGGGGGGAQTSTYGIDKISRF